MASIGSNDNPIFLLFHNKFTSMMRKLNPKYLVFFKQQKLYPKHFIHEMRNYINCSYLTNILQHSVFLKCFLATIHQVCLVVYVLI